jgi:GH15 family glucan-1,4-alpha-glucosidase
MAASSATAWYIAIRRSPALTDSRERKAPSIYVLFWLVEAPTRAGLAFPEKLDQARLLFERVLGYANHLGFYSMAQGEALGNFPQAFTHLALISAAFNLDRMLGTRMARRESWHETSL